MFVTKNTWITSISTEIFFRLRLSLAWPCTGARSWCFSDFSWFVSLYTLGTMVPQFAVCSLQYAAWSIDSFLHPYESPLPFTPVLTTQVFPLPRRHSRISIADLSASLKPCLMLTTQWTHYYTEYAFPVFKQKNHLISYPANLTKSKRGRRSNRAFVTNILQNCCRKNCIVMLSFFYRERFSSIKKLKRSE